MNTRPVVTISIVALICLSRYSKVNKLSNDMLSIPDYLLLLFDYIRL